jgi:hypothetical protein
VVANPNRRLIRPCHAIGWIVIGGYDLHARRKDSIITNVDAIPALDIAPPAQRKRLPDIAAQMNTLPDNYPGSKMHGKRDV